MVEQQNTPPPFEPLHQLWTKERENPAEIRDKGDDSHVDNINAVVNQKGGVKGAGDKYVGNPHKKGVEQNHHTAHAVLLPKVVKPQKGGVFIMHSAIPLHVKNKGKISCIISSGAVVVNQVFVKTPVFFSGVLQAGAKGRKAPGLSYRTAPWGTVFPLQPKAREAFPLAKSVKIGIDKSL